MVLGHDPTQGGVALDEVQMGGDVEQFGLDQLTESIDVGVDGRLAVCRRERTEVVLVVDVCPVESMDTADAILEAGIAQKVRDLALERRVVVHLDGVVDTNVRALAHSLDRASASLVSHVQVEAERIAVRAGPVSLEDVTVIGESDAL